MLNFKDFIEKALEGNGVQNDEKNVWVEVEEEQYTVSIKNALGREEQEPFEASYTLENNPEHEAWEELYDEYKGNCKARKYQVTDWYMDGENGEVAGIYDDIEEARKSAKEYMARMRRTVKECESSWVDICPLLDDEGLGDAIEIFRYEPVRS